MWSSGLRAEGVSFRVQGSGFRTQGVEVMVRDLRLRV